MAFPRKISERPTKTFLIVEILSSQMDFRRRQANFLQAVLIRQKVTGYQIRNPARPITQVLIALSVVIISTPVPRLSVAHARPCEHIDIATGAQRS